MVIFFFLNEYEKFYQKKQNWRDKCARYIVQLIMHFLFPLLYESARDQREYWLIVLFLNYYEVGDRDISRHDIASKISIEITNFLNFFATISASIELI